MIVRNCSEQDISSLCKIYNYYIKNSTCTFEETPVSERNMGERLATTQSNYPWLVCEDHGAILGYAYATAWKARSAYRHSAEVTVYVDKTATGKGVGKALYQELESQLRKQNIHALLAGISLPNPPSIALHEMFLFEKVAHLKQVGFKLEKWVDVGYWQKIL